CPVRPGIPHLYFCKDLRGYGWFYRKGRFLNVGLGREDNEQLSSHVQAFAEFLKAGSKIPKDTPGSFVGHAYLLYSRAPRSVIDDGVLLIGDAAGLAYAQSGEGIRPAIESGLMAAEVIAQVNAPYSRASMEAYPAQLLKRFGQKSSWSLLDYLPFALKLWAAG